MGSAHPICASRSHRWWRSLAYGEPVSGDDQPTLGLHLGAPDRTSSTTARVRRPADAAPSGRVVRVLPDVVGIEKEFDYLVPAGVEVQVGDVVRIRLAGRPIGGWVTALDVEPVGDVSLASVTKVSGRGPAAELVDLSAWAAWRWAGRRPHLLRTASPAATVRSLPAAAPRVAAASPPDPAVEAALLLDRAVLRMAPGTDRYPLVRAAVAAPTAVKGGRTLVLCPSVTEARALGRRLRRDGVVTAILAGETGAAGAGEWARARAGAVVVGARASAWAPVAPLGRVVVLDEHDEAYQGEQTPTWNAREVVIERARRAGAPCLLVSPTPSLEALSWGELVIAPRTAERAGWPRVDVVDQRDLDPTLGPLFSPALVRLVRSGQRVLCILNRTGRARMLACSTCSSLARCATCAAAVGQADQAAADAPERLACRRCGTERPVVCLDCGSTAFKQLRLGVSRAREELEVLAGAPVVEVTGAGDGTPDLGPAGVAIGTEALLHRVHQADAVAFLDFDQELLATRYRTAEQALGLLARAARTVSRRPTAKGVILVQTRTPEHPVLLAATHADPARFSADEAVLRSALHLPPSTAMAVVSGSGGEAFIEALEPPADLVVQGPVDGAWRLRAPDHQTLCDALAATPRPQARLRIEVDPLGA